MLTLTGSAGTLRWAYHQAADVGAWSLTSDASGGDLHGAIVRANDSVLARADTLIFYARGVRWPIISWTIEGTRLSARVVPPAEAE